MAKKVDKGGRPKGAKDAKPRKRRADTKTPDPWAKKTKDKRSITNKKLLLDQLKKFNFDVVQEILWMYDQLKGQCEIKIIKGEDGAEDAEMIFYPKEITQQMLEILKLLISHSFPKMKALELSTTSDNPITLNFNLGQPQKPRKVEGVAENPPEAIDMVSGPGGVHIPVIYKKKD